MKCEKCGTEFEGNVCPNGCEAPKPAKIKKPIYKKWWFWVIIAVIAVGVINSFDGSTEDTPVDTPTANEQSTQTNEQDTQTDEQGPDAETLPEDNVYEEGESIDVNGLIITYQQADKYVESNTYLQPKDGYMYIELKIAAENTSDSDRYISMFDFECYADGTKAEQYYSGDNNFEGGTLSAGRKSSGSIYFTVPIDATEIEVEYETNYWSDKKAIFKVEL